MVFSKLVRESGSELLKRLDDFPGAVLVAGCQRSGTSMLARIISLSHGVVNYSPGRGAEMEAAFILAGWADHQGLGRYCFQTTYLDDAYHEYSRHTSEFKIIWVVRNPLSVVWSMLHHWPGYALNNTFRRCGAALYSEADTGRYKLFGPHALSRLHRACLTYNGKVSQLFELVPRLGSEKILVVDYDDLAVHKQVMLPRIYTFVGLEYREEYAERIHARSLERWRQLPEEEITTIRSLCEPVYLRAKSYCVTATGQ
jgi:hypothetical protein